MPARALTEPVIPATTPKIGHVGRRWLRGATTSAASGCSVVGRASVVMLMSSMVRPRSPAIDRATQRLRWWCQLHPGQVVEERDQLRGEGVVAVAGHHVARPGHVGVAGMGHEIQKLAGPGLA